MDLARAGKITEEMEFIAKQENVDVSVIQRGVSSGRIVITKNVKRDIKPLAIGENLRIKINSNIGTSEDVVDVNLEIQKARISEKYGADTVMDLSTGGNIDEIRKKIIDAIAIPIGTVPIYQVAIEALRDNIPIVEMKEDRMLEIIERHAKDGVDFMTIHCGVTRRIIEHLKKEPRLMPMVSRGGTFLGAWILHNEKENPYFENYDYLLDLAKEYDFSISLGDGLRPGTILDATDWAQVDELLTIADLVKRARAKNVQVMVEGPGHVPLNQIEANVKLQKTVCDGAPFYVLGPLVTDIAPGYDHIVGAIGGALAGWAGADFLCYVTPSEHLGLPTEVNDVKEGVIASRIAAHAADIARRGKSEMTWDQRMSEARANLDWDTQFQLAIDPEKALTYFKRNKKDKESLSKGSTCTMCGKFCAIKILNEELGRDNNKKCNF
ncbi:MAG: phosphomethylpyrimidine synthase ThiC [Candidatus Lokiarchaeota archaeon]|nr:phosphomethylpyrimidine synthase ThiC [Candidatus Lokiarchaeota archaeon]